MTESKNPIHTVKTPYLPLRQGINLCGPTVLQMVLLRRGAVYYQEELAAYMGVYVSIDHKDSYSKVLKDRALPKVKYIDKDGKEKERDDARVGYLGERFGKKEDQERISGLGLETKIYRPSDLGYNKIVSSVEEISDRDVDKFFSPFIEDNLDQGNDIEINFRWDSFRGDKNGHHVLISSYNHLNHLTKVVDPSPVNPPFWKKNIKNFIFGQMPIWQEDDDKKRERPFIVFKGPEKLEEIDLREYVGDSSKKVSMYTPVLYKMERQNINPKNYPTPNIPQSVHNPKEQKSL